ncbi:MAG: hypothetical protein NTW89_07055 [Burkholderiales bacterium]|nr:hypothetical protein [Burkholderiales bacterium]
MVRLADLSEIEREHHLERLKQIPPMSVPQLVAGPALSQRRVALITTAGLHARADAPFDTTGNGTDYRVIATCPSISIGQGFSRTVMLYSRWRG